MTLNTFILSLFIVTQSLISSQLRAEEKAGKPLSKAIQQKIKKEFQYFYKTNQTLREKHQNELYQNQKSFLKKNHGKITAFFKEISKLQQTVTFAQREENKKIHREIEKRKQAFKVVVQADRVQARDIMKKKRETFQKKMDKLRDDFKNKVKALSGKK